MIFSLGKGKLCALFFVFYLWILVCWFSCFSMQIFTLGAFLVSYWCFLFWFYWEVLIGYELTGNNRSLSAWLAIYLKNTNFSPSTPRGSSKLPQFSSVRFHGWQTYLQNFFEFVKMFLHEFCWYSITMCFSLISLINSSSSLLSNYYSLLVWNALV